MSYYLDKSLQGRSVINNCNITNEFTFNDENIDSFIKRQISATSPVIYNSTSGNISLDTSNIQPLLTLEQNDLRYNSAGSLALATRGNLYLEFPDYVIGNDVYTIPSALQLDGSSLYLNYNPKQLMC